MKVEDDKFAGNQPASFTLTELLAIASASYPDEYLRVYYDANTGQFNEHGNGDTLAEFLVREIQQSFDAALTKAEQLDEVLRLLRNAVRQIEGVMAAVEAARVHATTDDHEVACWENEGGQ